MQSIIDFIDHFQISYFIIIIFPIRMISYIYIYKYITRPTHQPKQIVSIIHIIINRFVVLIEPRRVKK